MGAIPNVTRLNGKMMTRSSTAFRLNSLIRITGIDTWDWNDERPMPLVPGMNDGGPPLGVADGQYNCGSTVGIYLDEAPKFEAAILALNPLAVASGNLSDAVFQVTGTFREDVRTNFVLLVNCRVVGRPTRTVSNDGSAIVKQYTIQPTFIIEDGMSLVRYLTPAI